MAFVSKKYGFVFIHVPKTAGTSVHYAVERQVGGVLRPTNFALRRLGRIALPLARPFAHWRTHDPHASLRTLAPELEPGFLDEAFVFAFVRHPYDRLWSFYRHIRDCPTHGWHGKVVGYGGFAGMVEYLADVGEPSQRSYLVDGSDRLAVDFVGRYERLAEDWAAVCARLGLPPAPLDHENPGSGEAPPPLSRAQRERVYAYYEEDFRTFGYEP